MGSSTILTDMQNNNLTINNLEKLKGRLVVMNILYAATSNESVEVSFLINETVMGRAYYELKNGANDDMNLIIYRRIVDGHLIRVAFSTTHYCFISLIEMPTPNIFLEILESKRWIPN